MDLETIQTTAIYNKDILLVNTGFLKSCLSFSLQFIKTREKKKKKKRIEFYNTEVMKHD